MIDVTYQNNIPVIHNLPAGMKVLFMGITGEPTLVIIIGTEQKVEQVYIVTNWTTIAEVVVKRFQSCSQSISITTDQGHIYVAGRSSLFRGQRMLPQEYRLAAPTDRVPPSTSHHIAPMDAETLVLTILGSAKPAQVQVVIDQIKQAGGLLVKEEACTVACCQPPQGLLAPDIEQPRLPARRLTFILAHGFRIRQLWSSAHLRQWRDAGIFLVQ